MNNELFPRELIRCSANRQKIWLKFSIWIIECRWGLGVCISVVSELLLLLVVELWSIIFPTHLLQARKQGQRRSSVFCKPGSGNARAGNWFSEFTTQYFSSLAALFSLQLSLARLENLVMGKVYFVQRKTATGLRFSWNMRHTVYRGVCKGTVCHMDWFPETWPGKIVGVVEVTYRELGKRRG